MLEDVELEPDTLPPPPTKGRDDVGDADATGMAEGVEEGRNAADDAGAKASDANGSVSKSATGAAVASGKKTKPVGLEPWAQTNANTSAETDATATNSA